MKEYKVICPLINFQIPWDALVSDHVLTIEEVKALLEARRNQVIEGINLVDGVKIKQISNEDIEVIKSHPLMVPLNLREMISPKTFILTRLVMKAEDLAGMPDMTMLKAVLALRLLKEGYVYGNWVLYFQPGAEKYSRSLMCWWDQEPRESYALKYVLDFDEIPQLRALLERIQSIDLSKRRSWALACKRFQRVYEEGDPEDKLIDLMIAFEALFLKGEKGTSGRGRTIAIACSTLLGKNETEREEIKNTLLKAYKLRNSIVHGAEVKNDPELVDTVSETKNYLRESIKKLID